MISPYNLIQERLFGQKAYPWRMLVACVMLNQTSAKQVYAVLDEFLLLWPDPKSAAEANYEEVAYVVRSLGLQNRRAQTLIRMSAAYAAGFEDVGSLPGVGKYARDSYRIFVEGDLIGDAEDKELRRYVAWAKARRGDGPEGVRQDAQGPGAAPPGSDEGGPPGG